jgi:hypothetical protein
MTPENDTHASLAFDVLPASVAAYIEDVARSLQAAQARAPLLLAGAAMLCVLALIAFYVDWALIFEFRALTSVDPNTGLLPDDRWNQVAVMSLQGALAIMAVKLLFNTRRRRLQALLAISVLTLLFCGSLTIVMAVGEMPRYLALIEGLAQQGFSWGGNSPLIQNLAGIKWVYTTAFVGTSLPYLILPFTAALFLAYANEALVTAVMAIRDMRGFSRQHEAMLLEIRQAEGARLEKRTIETDFQVLVKKDAQEEIDKAVNRIDALNEMLVSGDHFHASDMLKVFGPALGQDVPRGADGLFPGFVKDREKTKLLAMEARAIINGNYLDRIYDRWLTSRGLSGL